MGEAGRGNDPDPSTGRCQILKQFVPRSGGVVACLGRSSISRAGPDPRVPIAPGGFQRLSLPRGRIGCDDDAASKIDVLADRSAQETQILSEWAIGKVYTAGSS